MSERVEVHPEPCDHCGGTGEEPRAPDDHSPPTVCVSCQGAKRVMVDGPEPEESNVLGA